MRRSHEVAVDPLKGTTMRLLTTLAAALALSTSLTATTTRSADACGGRYEPPAPRMLLVSSHGIHHGPRWSTRAFAVLETGVELGANPKWQPLAPMTYDATRILPLSRLAKPMELTLVGSSGTRVVKTDKQHALSQDFHIGFDQTRAALELPVKRNERFTIALAGRVDDAKWFELAFQQGTAAEDWWLAQQGYENVESVSVQPIAGTELQVVVFYVDGKPGFAARQGDQLIGGSSGQPLGVVSTGGRMFVVANFAHQIRGIELQPVTAPKA
jgi:hypothetical protein